jgi:putative transposase
VGCERDHASGLSDRCFMKAVRKRKPRDAIIHSDQGTQYGSDAWKRVCRANGLEPSMSRRGNCWDNAVAESFFSSLKKERIKKHIYKNRDAAIADITDCIDGFYNPTRRHRHLGGVSPDEFEAMSKRQRESPPKVWELHTSAAVGSCGEI